MGPLTGRLTFLIALACGAIVANLYYAQPILSEIGRDLGLSERLAGLITTMTQVGYCLGLLLLVPLGDVLENRRLSLVLLGLAFAASLAMALTSDARLFLAASLLIGVGSVAVQVLVPYAAHLSGSASQGRVVGRVMSGVLTGIMLARPIASLITDTLGWRAVFALAAVASAGAAWLIGTRLPARRPEARIPYVALLASMFRLAATSRILQRRAAYQALMFYSFTFFWTALPARLISPAFGLSQRQVAFVALAGVAGAVMATVAGRLADRGWARSGTALALAVAALAWPLTFVGSEGSAINLTATVIAAILLDGAVPTCLVLGQRQLFALDPDQRSRLNGLFLAAFFTGGAVGATAGVYAFHSLGWAGAAAWGAAGPVLALLLFAGWEGLGGSRANAEP